MIVNQPLYVALGAVYILSTAVLGDQYIQPARKCANPDNIYDVMIVHALDGTYEGTTDDFSIPMTADRNTLEFRTAAYDFFEANYGLVFDPADEGQQLLSDGSAIVLPLQLAADVPYRVLAFDDQTYSSDFQNRMQITNAVIEDIFYVVSALADITLPVTDYGVSEIFAGEAVIYGSYRIFIDEVYDEEVMPDIVYQTEFGEKLNMGPNTIIACAVEHPWFGKGRTRGVSNMVNNDDGTWTVNSRAVMTFPAALEDASTDGTGCQDLKPCPDPECDEDPCDGKCKKNEECVTKPTSLKGRPQCPGCPKGKCRKKKKPQGEECGNKRCKKGENCCNSSCGICTAPGGFCTQKECGPLDP